MLALSLVVSVLISTLDVALSWRTSGGGCIPISRQNSSTRPTMTPSTRACLTRCRAMHPFIKGVAAAGISREELKCLKQAFVFACQDQEVGYSLDEIKLLPDPAIPSNIPGATGRVLLLQQSGVPDDEVEDLQTAISSEMDELMYAQPPLLTQPILLSIEKQIPNVEILKQFMQDLVSRTVDTYEMAMPLPRRNPKNGPRPEAIPTSTVQVDGAMVTATSGESFWDTSSLLVFDNLISDDLRNRLLDVVNGKQDLEEGDWDDDTNGPDPRRWVRGGLMDLPDQDVKPCWGLTDEAIDDLCLHDDSLEEFETIVSDLFPDYCVSRLSEAVLGETVSPLTANAPTHGDTFAYHIDADPNMTPPSPWTDVYGRYPNRQPGKPRFMSCLVYLNKEWDEAWGAPTRFLDVATDTHYDVKPRPGRCVLMDQDITHSVVAPSEAAGKRPRYSLVWKLILHPKVHGQDMQVQSKDWPEPIRLGSANLNGANT